MDELAAFNARWVGILGLARSGLAAAKALRAAGAEVLVFDDNPEALARAVGEGYTRGRAEAVGELALLVPSPGVPLTHPLVEKARAAGVAVCGDIDLFAGIVAPRRIIGITGTNGKSTTTALVHHLLVEAGLDAVLGGNIGTPVMGLEPGPADRIFVLELSSFQLDLCERLRCDVAVWLNLSGDHLDRHGYLASYRAAKMRIFANHAAGAPPEVAIDDEDSRAVVAILTGLAVKGLPAPAVIPVSGSQGLREGVFVRDGILVDSLEGRRQEVADLRGIAALRGRHNAQNALAAYAAVRALGLAPQVASRGLATFLGLPHRLETVARKGSVLFVNDSKATNPEAAARALESFEEIYWIAGGRAKPGGFKDLRPFMAAVRGGWLIGEAADAIASDLGDLAPLHKVGTLEEALVAAGEAAGRNGSREPVVLLAPACASFDQFRDFEARGERFASLARAFAGAAEDRAC